MKHRPLIRVRSAVASTVAACGIAFAVFAAGCDKPAVNTAAPVNTPASTAGERHTVIGIVDIDRVISANNWATELQNDRQTATAEIKRQAESYIKEMDAQLAKKKETIGKAAKLNTQQMDDLTKNQNLDKLPLTDAQKQELGTALYIYQQVVQNMQQQANGLMQQRQQAIVAGWVNAMQPVIRRVAEAKKVNVVFRRIQNNMDVIVWNDDTVDITNGVIDDLAKSQITRPQTPPLPKLELQPVNLDVPKAPVATQPATAPSGR